MKELIKYEILKIFERKLIYIVAVAIAFFALAFHIASYFSVNAKFGGMEEVKSTISQYEGEITEASQMQVKKEKEIIGDKLANKEKLTTREEIIYNYLREYYVNEDKYTIGEEIYTLKDLQERLVALETINNTDSYEYKNLKKAEGMISKLQTPTYHYKHGWINMADFNVAGTMLCVLLVLGLATIFSEDHQSNVAPIILSTVNGRSKLNTAKIIAAVIFALITFLYISILYAIPGLIYGLEGGELPLNFYRDFNSTPFDITMVQFYFTALGIRFIGVLTLSLIIVLISLLVKNNMLALFLSLGIYFIPSMIMGFNLPDAVYKIISGLDISAVIRVKGMFQSHNTYNVFGNPVLYPTLMIALTLILIPILIWAITHFGRKQEI